MINLSVFVFHLTAFQLTDQSLSCTDNEMSGNRDNPVVCKLLVLSLVFQEPKDCFVEK